MIVVDGVDRLAPEHGRLFVVIGVFDGLHLGHRYLLEHLVQGAAARDARPTVITFDHHPDEVLTGSAPPLLLDPGERLARLEAAGVLVTVVQHFDEATRLTPFDAFVRRIADRVELAGFLMTPESSFGRDRGGTPATVAALGRRLGFEVAVVPTLVIDGRPVRSSDIRAAIAAGELAAASRLLGRAYAIVGAVDEGGWLTSALPMATPPEGSHPATVDGRPESVRVESGARIRLEAPTRPRAAARVTFLAR